MTNLSIKVLREQRLSVFEKLVNQVAATHGVDLGDSNSREEIELEVEQMCENWADTAPDAAPSPVTPHEQLLAEYFVLGQKILDLDDGDLDDDDREG